MEEVQHRFTASHAKAASGFGEVCTCTIKKDPNAWALDKPSSKRALLYDGMKLVVPSIFATV